MYYIYIIECFDGSLYTGSTIDVEKRFKDHLVGKGAKYTKSHKPVKVVYQEEFVTKSEALRREIEIKKWPKGKKHAMIANQYKPHSN
ncbi:MAG TPA: GIY-YIG nuclease family protein [Patescibacteria group bacterium]|nr:GIY-YIG nuclease family protein [Patescibacteria group bacterium]